MVESGDYHSPVDVLRASLDFLDAKDGVVQTSEEAPAKHDARPI